MFMKAPHHVKGDNDGIYEEKNGEFIISGLRGESEENVPRVFRQQYLVTSLAHIFIKSYTEKKAELILL